MLPTNSYLGGNISQQHLQYNLSNTTEEEDLRETPSLSSSPISQYSSVYHGGIESQTAYSSLAVPRTIPCTDVGALEIGDSQLMNSDDWNQTIGLSRGNIATRTAHNRDSSHSSLGSIGPASPYGYNGIAPRIAIAESGHDGLSAVPPEYSHDSMWAEANYALESKQGPFAGHMPTEVFLSGAIQSNGRHGMHFVTMNPRTRPDPGTTLAPPIEINNLSRSGAESVASSTTGGDSPATPGITHSENSEGRRREGEYSQMATSSSWRHGDLHRRVFREVPVPKLERSITDACQDSIYSNNMAVGSSSPSHQDFVPSQQFSRALEAANSQHLKVDQPMMRQFRGSSPFRSGSALAPASGAGVLPASSCQSSPTRDPSILHGNRSDGGPENLAGLPGTPQTMSPQDAMLDMDDVDDAVDFPLFPPDRGPSYRTNQNVHQPTRHPSHVPFLTVDDKTNVRVPQRYPFIPSPVTVESARQPLSPEMSHRSGVSPQPRTSIMEDGGTYSCTYHGCKMRFDTQKDLQAHKREGHRAAGTSRRGERGPNQQTQHGPHICNRINPSTNKICGSKFSRPYDLTRHEDTIHNAKKQKLRCRVCPDEKLFSRRDALNRHFKVCHEELFDSEFPSRRRRMNRS